MSTLREWLEWFAERWWGQLVLILLVGVGSFAILGALFALFDLLQIDPQTYVARVAALIFALISLLPAGEISMIQMMAVVAVLLVGITFILGSILRTPKGIDHGVAMIAAQLRVNALPPEDRHDEWPQVTSLEEREEKPRP